MDLNDFTAYILQHEPYVSLEPSVKDALRDDILDRTERNINQRIVEFLTPSQLRVFEKLLDKHSDQQTVQSFLQTSLPNLQEIITTVLVALKDQYIH